MAVVCMLSPRAMEHPESVPEVIGKAPLGLATFEPRVEGRGDPHHRQVSSAVAYLGKTACGSHEEGRTHLWNM